jgi:hypothetical protein
VVLTGLGSYVTEDLFLFAGFFATTRFFATDVFFVFFMRRTLQQRPKGGQ